MDYKDEGHGITVKSLEFWDQHKLLIGEVTHVAGSFEPLAFVPIPDPSDITLAPLEYNLKIYGLYGTILLSGCNCGYSGEGPNGTRKILEELGIDHDKAVELAHRKRFVTEIGMGGY